MTYVITEPCVGVKDKACVIVCPVDCIHEADTVPGTALKGDTMLYIDPEECIDCNACLGACPVDACFPEDEVPTEWHEYIEINAKAFEV
jgi:ferredoxin